MIDNNEKQRIIQEYVPGKQVSLAHVIARPDINMLAKVGLNEYDNKAVGIMTITPSEAVIIAADMAIKVANVSIGFLDRFNGSLILVGMVSDVETALQETSNYLESTLHFSIAPLTKS